MSCASEAAAVRVAGDLGAMGPPPLHAINEDAALQVVAEMLDALDRRGLAVLRTEGQTGLCSMPSSSAWTAALAALATAAPLNTMIADTLLDRVYAALMHEVELYRRAICGGGEPLTAAVAVPALERLGAVYAEVHPYLLRWCTMLRAPGVAALLAVRVRCAVLQRDLVTGEEPPGKRALFAFLWRHGRSVLAAPPPQSRAVTTSRAGTGEDDGAEEDAADRARHSFAAPLLTDAVVACLHRLTLSRSTEVRQLWRSVLEDGIHHRLRDLSDDFTTRVLHEQLAWLAQSVVPLVQLVLMRGGAADDVPVNCGACASPSPATCAAAASLDHAQDSEQEAWCAELRQLLLRTYARRRLDDFWEILSDYPDSAPALEDMHDCLQANPESSFKGELVQTVRHLLSTRLHRAGTRTEDILAILTNTIHAFCILFPRNEQSSVVFSVISDTLEHLRRRKDCVTAIVQAVMQPGSAMNAAPPPPSSAPGVLIGDAGVDYLRDGAAARLGDGEVHRVAARDRPDVLRVLLTSIHRRALVEEYQTLLAELLLQKPMHEFDTVPEEEVLERLRQVFGETVLDRCAVMVRDMQMSRRITQQLREQMARRRLDRGAPVPMPPASVSVLSMTTWPSLARCSASSADAGAASASPSPAQYRPHPALQGVMDQLAEAYKALKDNQRLTWLPSLGRVEVELTQLDPSKGNAPVSTPHLLSLFDASVVLHVKELASSSYGAGASGGGRGQVAISAVAAAMQVPLEEVLAHVQRLSPAALVHQPGSDFVAMQVRVAASADYVFAEDHPADAEDAKPAGLPPERVKLMERMVTSLLKTRGPQPITSIHSSLKLLAKFEGPVADVADLLQSFVRRGLIVLNDAKQYALPPK